MRGVIVYDQAQYTPQYTGALLQRDEGSEGTTIAHTREHTSTTCDVIAKPATLHITSHCSTLNTKHYTTRNI